MTKPPLVYHLSNERHLSFLVPRPLDTYHDPALRKKKLLYLTSSRQYASAFGFPWLDSQGIALSSYDNNKTFEIIIPKTYVKELDIKRDLSLYTFKFNDRVMKPISNTTPEFTCTVPLEVYKEETFSSAREVMDTCGLKIFVK